MSADDEAAHRGLRELLGSYALGHLSPADDDRLRAHLDGCPECRAQLDELAPLADRLGLVDARAFGDVPVPPPTLGEDVRRAVTQARAERDADELAQRRAAAAGQRRRRWAGTLTAAAVVLVALVGGAMVGRATAPDPGQVPLEAISMEVGTDDDVTVESADLVDHTWGVELRIVALGFDAGETFRAEFRTTDGRLVPAGEFRGVGTRTMTCFLQSSTMREDVTQVLVTDESGDTVLSSNL